MTLPLGYRVDAYDYRDRLTAHLMCVSKPLGGSDRADMTRFRGPHIRQRNTSACVGFALARAIQMSLWVQGYTSAPMPNALDLYVKGRRQQYAGMGIEELPPLRDEGSFPRLVMQACRAAGFIPEESWPFDPAHVNDDVPPFALAVSYGQRELSYYRVEGAGQARIDAMVYALSAGFPVIFGMRVDRPFLDHYSPTPIKQVDASQVIGGHMMAVLSINEPSNTALVDNWWERDWGGQGDGVGLLSLDLLRSSLVSDVYAVRAAPLYARGG